MIFVRLKCHEDFILFYLLNEIIWKTNFGDANKGTQF